MRLYVKNIAVAGMITALTVVLLYLTAILQWNTIFLLVLAAYLTGTLCYLTTIPQAAAGMTAAGILSFLFTPVKTYVLIYLLLAIYVIVSEAIYKARSRENALSRGKEWGIKALVWHALVVTGGILAVFCFSLLTGTTKSAIFFPLSSMPPGAHDSQVSALQSVCYVFFSEPVAEFITAEPLVWIGLILAADIFWILFDRVYLYYARLVNLRLKSRENIGI